jgi:hypothetical protein
LRVFFMIGSTWPTVLGQALREHRHHAVALEGVVDARVEGVDVARQAALAPQVVVGVLVGREDVARGHAEAFGDAARKRVGLARLVAP